MESVESPEVGASGQQQDGEATQLQAEEEAPDPAGERETTATPPTTDSSAPPTTAPPTTDPSAPPTTDPPTTDPPASEQHEEEPPAITEVNEDNQAAQEEPTAAEGGHPEEPNTEGEEKEGVEGEGLSQREDDTGPDAGQPEEGKPGEQEDGRLADSVPGVPAGGVEAEAEETTVVQLPAAQPEKKDKKAKSKKKDKPKDKEKKQKKKSKPLELGGAGGSGVLKKLSSKAGGTPSSRSVRGGQKQVEAIMLSMFQPYDPDGSGYLDPTVFWQILQSAELNLQLTVEEIVALQEVILPDSSGQMPYAEFASQTADIIASLNQNLPESETNWIELRSVDNTVVISLNKRTGEVRDLVEAGVDLFEETIQDMYQAADSQGKGFVSKEDFTQMLQSEPMVAYLSEEDILQMQQFYDAIPSGQATFADFYPLAKELILRVYRVRDDSDSEWCQLSSPRVGIFWFNKYTGETQRDAGAAPTHEREQEIAFLNQVYAQLESANFELERYKQENRELQNQLAQANEEQETLAAQLYETGHELDQATVEIQNKEEQIGELNAIIASKDQDITELSTTVTELEQLRESLAHAGQELQNARDTIAARDKSISERDAEISQIQQQNAAITDRMMTANGAMDARDSSISSLKHQLHLEQAKVKAFEQQVPELESRLSSAQEELQQTKRGLEEKVQALGQARRHLKNARERNMDMEKEAEKQTQTQEKLRSAECEIHTLKSLLTTKTAMVERRKKELTDAKMKVVELEEKDHRRAVILADVLEKTARQYQQQIMSGAAAAGVGVSGTSPTRAGTIHPPLTPISERPVSAPPIPPEGDHAQPIDHSPPLRVMKSFTLGGKSAPTTASGAGTRATKTTPGRRARVKGRSKTVPKLPPVRAPPQKRAFVFPTSNDLRRRYKGEDASLIPHNPYNPQCSCKLCLMNASIGDMGMAAVRPDTGFTGLATTQSGYHSETDERELTLAQQVRIGQRVLVRMKKSEFDLEPQELTGIVKYVGKIDSEFVDNKLYVGVKLDEGVGDTDGLIKGKRYFTCPAKHGKVVRITNVIAVLPNKSVFYKPLEGITRRSPYSTFHHKKSSSIRVS